MRTRGFTLLEVLVAVAILGLGLSVILSSQVGLFSSATHAEHLSVAVNLGRCRMTELEEQLLREGYSAIDQTEEGPCCDDEVEPGFSCSWKIEKIELPAPKTELDLSTDALGGGLGPLGGLASIQQSGGAVLGADAGLSSLGGVLGGASMGGTASMAPFLMSLVYPDLKLMLEASIRKVTVRVTWLDGQRARELPLVEYVTDPKQGGLDPNAAQGLP